jgi:hypothetical protein
VAEAEEVKVLDTEAFFPKPLQTQTETDDNPEDQVDDTPSDEADTETEEESQDELDAEESADEQEPEDDEDDEEEEALEPDDDTSQEADVYKQHAANLQQQLDTVLRQNEQLLSNQNQEVVNTEPDAFAGKDDDDYPTVGELRKIQKAMRVPAPQPQQAQQPQQSNADLQWIMAQPDYADMDKYITKNKAVLNMHPDVMAAGTSDKSKYFAVKSIMKDERIRELRRAEKKRKKFKKQQKERGKVPNTETGTKRRTTTKKEKDPVRGFFNQKWNKVVE